MWWRIEDTNVHLYWGIKDVLPKETALLVVVGFSGSGRVLKVVLPNISPVSGQHLQRTGVALCAVVQFVWELKHRCAE